MTTPSDSETSAELTSVSDAGGTSPARLQVGSAAPRFEALDTDGVARSPIPDAGQLRLVCFFRHAGCPPCNLRMRELIRAEASLAEHGIDVLTLFESSSENISKHLSRGEVPYPIIPDRQRRFYKKYGVSTSMAGFLKSMFIKPLPSMKAVFGHGYRPRLKENTTLMPAEFLIDSTGTIKLAYYGSDIGDYASLNEIYEAARD